MPDKLISKRYLLHEPLGEGGMGVVYRTTNRLTGQTVALKRVTTPTKNLSFSTRSLATDLTLALAQEFRILSSLRHPHIISVLDYGFDTVRQPFFTMELLEQPQTITEAGQKASIALKVTWLTQLAQALAYLHRRNILHRDLKPSNVLVAGEQVQVVDFGLAVEGTIARGIVGTTLYMAPEILSQETATEASDFYAVGVMAYELLVGHHPFRTTTLVDLINDHLYTEPNWAPIEALAINFTPTIKRLLAKQPEARYTHAGELIRDLRTLMDVAVSSEADAIRESFLQAAAFVGREAELEMLLDGLHKLIHQQPIAPTSHPDKAKRTRAWLLGGESGIGKSRLLEELRTHALVSGVSVLQGQAVREGGEPYQLWHGVLQQVCLEASLDDLEAGVLKSIVPEIDMLLERLVTDPPELEPEAAQERLLQVCENIFKRHHEPTLIILEDIHWADTSSIALLKRLMERSDELPVMIVASYRNDEAPKLPETLPLSQQLSLMRFNRPQIERLSASMLGRTAGHNEQVISLLERETEGNIFFIIEVMRALAEETGKLEEIGQATLPLQVFSGGMKAMVRRRLNRIPAIHQPLLRLAAVAGRQLDLALAGYLAAAITGNGFDLERWLDACVEATVLEMRDEQWRFAHDKLREGLLDDLPADERRILHQQVAEAMEAVAPGHSAALAYHWGMAGNAEKERHYATLAGEQALESGAYIEAIRFGTRALELGQDAGKPAVWQGQLQRLVAEAHYRAGEPKEGQRRFKKVLEVLERPTPAQIGRGVLKEVAIHLWHRFRIDWLRMPWRKAYYDYDYALTAIRGCARSAMLALYNNEKLAFIYYAVQSANIAERAGPALRAELARRYAILALVAGTIPIHRLARHYLDLAKEKINGTGSYDVESTIAAVEGAYALGRGQWALAETRLEHGIQLKKHIGSWFDIDELVMSLGFIYYYRGDWDKEHRLYVDLMASTEHSGNIQTKGVALRRLWHSAMLRGQLDEAARLAEACDAVPEQFKDQSDHFVINAFFAQLYLYQGDLTTALNFARRSLALARAQPPLIYSALDGYSALAECCLIAWETRPTDEHRQLARETCDWLRKYTRRFAIGKARRYLYKGWLHQLKGETTKAQQAGRRAIFEAKRLGNPYDEGIACYILGRSLSGAERTTYLQQAEAILERLGANYHLAQVRLAASHNLNIKRG